MRARGKGDVDVGADFDFEKSNAMLDQLKISGDDKAAAGAAAVEAPAPVVAAVAYNKTDFFDTLSRGSERTRDGRQHQRETDLATFGELTLPSHCTSCVLLLCVAWRVVW